MVNIQHQGHKVVPGKGQLFYFGPDPQLGTGPRILVADLDGRALNVLPSEEIDGDDLSKVAMHIWGESQTEEG